MTEHGFTTESGAIYSCSSSQNEQTPDLYHCSRTDPSGEIEEFAGRMEQAPVVGLPVLFEVLSIKSVASQRWDERVFWLELRL